MLTVELPMIPRVEALTGSAFQTVLFCRFVALSGNTRRLDRSQRQVLSMFNRSNQRRIGKYLSEAQRRGFLKKVESSSGILPDSYVRGELFASDTDAARALITLS